MKIINFIWGFSLGGGIDKCFVRYASLGNVDSNLEMVNVCIYLENERAIFKDLSNVNVHFIPIKSRKDFSWIRALYNLFDEEKPDVLFAHGFNGAVVAGIMRVRRKFLGGWFLRGWFSRGLFSRGGKGVNSIKIFCSYHGLYMPLKWNRKFVAPIYNFLAMLVYRAFCYKVICVAESAKRELLSNSVPNSKICVVYNGVEDERLPEKVCETSVCEKKILYKGTLSFDGEKLPVKNLLPLKSSDKGPLVIVAAARLSHEKGLEYLIRALDVLKKQGESFICNIYGDGPDYKFLKDLIVKCDLASCVFLKGYSNDIKSEFIKSDIYVSSSIYEAHSISILEAMRSEMAIIATNINEESVRDNKEGLLVPSQDVFSLSNALRIMLNDKNLRFSLGKGARARYLKMFTVDNMMCNLVNVLES